MSAPSDGSLVLRSYRLAFDLERRIHRVDRFRIPLPYGLPLTGLAYGVGALVVVLMAQSLPALGAVLHVLPWPLRLIFLPALTAQLLCRQGSDERPFHEALVARMLRAARPTHLVGLTRAPRQTFCEEQVLVLAPDELHASYRAGTVAGPASVLLRQPARLTAKGRTVRLEQLADRPMLQARELELVAGQRLVIACASR